MVYFILFVFLENVRGTDDELQLGVGHRCAEMSRKLTFFLPYITSYLYVQNDKLQQLMRQKIATP